MLVATVIGVTLLDAGAGDVGVDTVGSDGATRGPLATVDGRRDVLFVVVMTLTVAAAVVGDEPFVPSGENARPAGLLPTVIAVPGVCQSRLTVHGRGAIVGDVDLGAVRCDRDAPRGCCPR